MSASCSLSYSEPVWNQQRGVAATTAIVLGWKILDGAARKRFEEHLSSLPTHAEMLRILEIDDASYQVAYRESLDELRQSLLGQVREGKITRLAAERMGRGMTQAELAETVGMHQSNIARLERLGVGMSPSSAKKIGKALELDDWRVLLP